MGRKNPPPGWGAARGDQDSGSDKPLMSGTSGTESHIPTPSSRTLRRRPQLGNYDSISS